ncbi:hypothetical protein SCHPADRAFT_493006 [Schizopora paradoxa]|uniref:BTB domain-containing protein n=1 Tax=Schizopora paradoxa TaxID=27342 RepID=A0A0H2S1V2_9AGAM|nr:hypothetical protein SCHPADRAFT_493006 [Schizopora paradoxa]
MASNINIASGAHPNYAAEDADVVLVSSDNVVFHVHSLMLREASTVFENMVRMPAPQDIEKQPTDNTIKLDEPAFVVEFLMDSIYPRDKFPTVSNYAEAWEIAKAADKYLLGRALTVLRGFVLQNEQLRGQTLRLYNLACKCHWTDVIESSSKASLDKPLLNLRYMEPEVEEQFFELSKAEAQRLLRLHKNRAKVILRFDAEDLTTWLHTIDDDGSGKMESLWWCPDPHDCGAMYFDEEVNIALVSLKNELQNYVDREPVASALSDRKSFKDLFRQLMRISTFKRLRCDSCKTPLMDEETVWKYFQAVMPDLPVTVSDFETEA